MWAKGTLLSFPRDILIIFETFAFRLYEYLGMSNIKFRSNFLHKFIRLPVTNLIRFWWNGNGNAKIRTKCGKMYVSLVLGNFTRRYYPTTVIHEARGIDFHEVSNVKKRKKSKEKKERRKRKKRRNARGACIVRELSPPMVF